MAPKPLPDYTRAAYELVHTFGAKALADLMGVAESTLYNKVNPNDQKAHLTGPEIIVATLLTSDTRLLQAMCRATRGAYYTLPSLTLIADQHLLEMFTRMGREESDLQTAIVRAFDDQVVTQREVAVIEREASELISTIVELVERVKGMARA
ncbi:hypothetical protein IGB42_02617 [Andreprevotia sp. IGB-42]|uniref:phage regulatory CII family protein n=1 Tax=Andreprevotia sp. IGB-42 TaxID=2497473 RepID=UPI00135B06CF|nr:phage regulatory CII family protein [Andreprevotia sp. IGB-42]KAF0812774.1 hypothetical protein IGB42_02617 [Andreprevotia sp. IGB-42]